MKKFIKRTVYGLVVVFALVGFGGSALAASGYITWGGSEAYHNLMETLQLIGDEGAETKTERDTYYRQNEQLTNQLKDKDNLLEAKQKEIDNLKKSDGQLKQAEQDMKAADQKAKEILNNLK